MKLMHLSDLHLGKRVNGFSMIEDQKYILDEMIGIIDSERPDGVMIAGDIYDKPVPPVEAVELLDRFLKQLAERRIQTFIISGNHDSSERLSFASDLIGLSGIHISQTYTGTIQPFELKDEFGTVYVYLLPFVKPAQIRLIYPDMEIETYTDAIRVAIDKMRVNPEIRNVLISHQFITGAEKSDSEELYVGGTENVDVSVFAPFDYVALGHIHKPQKLSRDTVRYCGTPLKYSFSECEDQKSVTIVELKEKGNTIIRTIPLIPLRDMRKIKGAYAEVTDRKNYINMDTSDYVQITLTDEDDVLDAAEKLRTIYPNLMKLEYDNTRTRNNAVLVFDENIRTETPLDLFSDFYRQQNGDELTDNQTKFLSELIEKIW